MPSQLNPAWQRKTLSSSHLATISERFLSEGPSGARAADGCQVIPFLLADCGQEWVVQELCGVFTQRGQQSHWQTLSSEHADTALQALRSQLQHPEHGGNGVRLLASDSPAAIIRHRLDHVVLLVPASLDGVMTAYRRIKRLAGEHTPDIGVVVVGPRDQHAAWRYFRKLAVGALRYLDVPLLNLGYLPQQVAPEEGPRDHHRDNFLTRIAERLLRSGFHCHLPVAGVDAPQEP